MSIQPWIRNYSYINDWFWTSNQYYEKLYRAYPCNYYTINRSKTIWDSEKIMGGSYEKLGVGELSGVKWDKIVMVPIFSVEQILPSEDSGEKGLTYKDSLKTQIVIPYTYGIEPIEWDVVDLNFGINADSPKIKPLYVVSGVNLSHHGEYYRYYQVRLEVASYRLDELEQQVENYYMFHNSIKKIYTFAKSSFLLMLEKRYSNINSSLDTIYDPSTNLYLKSKDYV